QLLQLVMAHRRRGAEEGLRGDARKLRDLFLGERRIRGDLAIHFETNRAPRPTERLFQPPAVRGFEVLLDELELDHRSIVRIAGPRSERLEVRLRRGDLPGERELDRPLNRGLAGLVGAADNGQAGRQLEVQRLVAPGVLEAETRDPHSVTSWP